MSFIVPRCERCWLHQPLCVCRCLVPRESLTKVTIISHFKELGRNSNSARLIPLCLRRGRMLIRGLKGQPLPSDTVESPGYQPIVLYPSSDALCLSQFDLSGGPVHLIVPDGNWRQSRRIVRREPLLKGLPTVRLPDGPPSRFRLRRQSQSAHVSTCEAIARALGFLETPELEQHLDHAFRIMVDRTLWSRGLLASEHVYGGLPIAALRPSLQAGQSPRVFQVPKSRGQEEV